MPVQHSVGRQQNFSTVHEEQTVFFVMHANMFVPILCDFMSRQLKRIQILGFVLLMVASLVRTLQQQKMLCWCLRPSIVVSVFSAFFHWNLSLVLLPWLPPLHCRVIHLHSRQHFPLAAPPGNLSWCTQSNWLCDAVKFKTITNLSVGKLLQQMAPKKLLVKIPFQKSIHDFGGAWSNVVHKGSS